MSAIRPTALATASALSPTLMAPLPASSGMIASIGMTATSWNSRIAKPARPAGAGGRQREAEAGPRRPRRRHARAGDDAAEHDGAGEELAGAEPEHIPAQLPQALRLELEADQEQEEHDAELGEVQHALAVLDEAERVRPDGDPRHQVAEDGAELEALEQRHRHARGGQEDDRLLQERHRQP